MRTDPWSEDACPITRTMAVLGQRWATQIIREALLGRSRFSEFREQLGVSSDVLSARLAELVDAGILAVEDYREPGERTRSRYVLTDAGHDLVAVLAAMGQWGHKHRATAKRSGYRFIEKSTGEHALVVFRRHDGVGIPTRDVTLIDSFTSG